MIDDEIKQYIKDHKQAFENQLLDHAVNVSDKIDDILRFGEIDLINNAHKLVNYVIMATNLRNFNYLLNKKE